MAHSHAVQHKVSREDRKAHEIADLKRENSQLKRTITRLRKEIAKRGLAEDLIIEENPLIEKTEFEAKVITTKCGKCDKGSIKIVELGERIFHICDVCKDRKRVN